MFIKYEVRHYSENRHCIYSMFAFDNWNDAIHSFNNLCKAYENTHHVISIYKFSYDDNMYFEITYTNL